MLVPCANPECTTRINPAHVPGKLCGHCFRQLGPKRQKYEQRQLRDQRDGMARHTVKP